jgi:excisionase family DNA binding protein
MATRAKTTTKTYDLTAREAAERVDVNPETIKRMARDGRVPARKDISGFWRFNSDDVDKIPIRGVIEVNS